MVFITTQLQGNDTQFLPFNKGHNQGKGNLPNPTGCRTAYLAEEIWHPDSVLNLIKNFIQLTPENRLIFPRYHQLDAVRKLLADALAKGAGQRYLIQHSAGSGKSNTIAWLSHQLKNLFDPNDQRVFNSIIVISDRNIVNEQLQDNIQQFEQVLGTVATPKTGAELKKALQDGKQVIVCSLFLFPQVLRVTSKMLNRRFAVLIDEAHSSQGGKTTRSMNAVLADVEEDGEDFIVRETKKRGRLNNISYFAFTATPKNTILELFGEPQADGKYYPFHLYSMRQAIEEGFILDVLQNYTTYEQYYRLLQDTTEDPRCSTGKLVRALHNFVNLNEEMINEKVAIIVEHFCDRVQQRIDHKAKAMIITSSRAQAVRYKQAVDAYIQEKGYTFKTLVAFSQTVTLNGVNYTEYVRLYLYLSQIVKFIDVDLEKLYSLGHLLLTKIQPSQQESPFTLPQGIELEAYRIQETFSGSINLDNTAETELQAPAIKGSGTPTARAAVPLSQVIQEFNNRYGVNLTDADKVCVETVTERLSQNEKLKQQVQVNADKAQTTFNETAQKQMISLFRANIPGFQDFYSKTKKNKDFETARLTWMFAQFIDKVKEPDRGETVQK